MKQDRKGQSGIDLLMTYGWIVVVGVGAVIILSQTGVFNPVSCTKNRLAFSQTVPTDWAVYRSSNTLVLNVENLAGDDVEIKKILAALGGLECSLETSAVIEPGGEAVFVLACSTDPSLSDRFNPGSCYNAEISVTYKNTFTGNTYDSKGTISGPVEEGLRTTTSSTTTTTTTSTFPTTTTSSTTTSTTTTTTSTTSTSTTTETTTSSSTTTTTTTTTTSSTSTTSTTTSTTTTAFVFSLPHCGVMEAFNRCPSYIVSAGTPGAHCSSDSDCGWFTECINGACCDPFSCTKSGRCYDWGDVISSGGYKICGMGGEWKVAACGSCTRDSDCYWNNCDEGHCATAPFGCWYNGGYYTSGALDLPGGCDFDIECELGRWVKGECMPCSAGDKLGLNLHCVEGVACGFGDCGYDCGCYTLGDVIEMHGTYYGCQLGGEWKKIEGSSCTNNAECYFLLECKDGYCCDFGSCGYNGACYSSGSPSGYPYVCELGEWKKIEDEHCSSDSECALGLDCTGGVCTPW